ncbi:hypothetical protein FACS1894200_07060 [Spirochaetia bacterium]|nr:hypothetical protein FACS1894200_07060 [Spirochaetia bacterium]
MTHGKDWLPGSRAARLEMAKSWAEIMVEKCAGWNIPPAVVVAFDGFITTAEAALSATTGASRGPVATEASREAFKALVANMRFIKDRYFKVPPLTNEDLVALGLTPKDQTRSLIGPSESRPGFESKPVDVCRIGIRIWDEATGEKRRPYGMNGGVLAYGFGDSPLATRKELNRAALITKSPYILTAAEEYRGKLISMAMCWQTASGDQGPWSEIQSTIVP